MGKEKSVSVKMIKSPCQSCGKPVEIPSDFVGCIFCEKCLGQKKSWNSKNNKEK